MNPNVFGQLGNRKSHVNEVLIDGVWCTYKECRALKEGVNPEDLKPSVPGLRFLAAGVFEHRCNGVIQDRLTMTHIAGKSYAPEPRAYWA